MNYATSGENDMRNSEPGKNREVWVATILMALFSSALCAVGGFVYLVVQWNNPIWDQKVRIIFMVGILIFAGLAALLGFFYRKQIS